LRVDAFNPVSIELQTFQGRQITKDEIREGHDARMSPGITTHIENQERRHTVKYAIPKERESVTTQVQCFDGGKA
jgi:hypothetical protein